MPLAGFGRSSTSADATLYSRSRKLKILFPLQTREKFEPVLGSKPTPEESSVASYNVACCYSKLNQVKAGLSALEDALLAGYEDFKRVRTDPDLENLRASEEFDVLLKRTKVGDCSKLQKGTKA
ncbi:hypothetical protein KPL71_002847 [Citrus sinensis]|uniref:Uncharacterized protein n=1 Tax=Citrus sinensis TaxID=2711 RepID=A0ACB8MUA1_CITSI|nr:hypothetical protein KPL71_002847 [Citrus sinensis]